VSVIGWSFCGAKKGPFGPGASNISFVIISWPSSFSTASPPYLSAPINLIWLLLSVGIIFLEVPRRCSWRVLSLTGSF